MPKLLLALAFLFPHAVALAQAPAIEAPACYPLVNGVHAMAPRVVDGEVGRHIFWACSPRGGTAKVYGWSCLHGHCLAGSVNAAHAAILSATARVGAAQTAYRQAMAYDCPAVAEEDSPRGRLCRERVRLMFAHGPEWLLEVQP